MKRKLFGQPLLTFIAGFVIVATLFTACEKENEAGVVTKGGVAKVQVLPTGVGFGQEGAADSRKAAKQATSLTRKTSTPAIQVSKVDLGDDLYLEATVEDISAGEPVASGLRASAKAATQAESEQVVTPLANGVMYRVLVFDGEEYLDARDYVVGAAMPEPFELEAGKEYGFYIYSFNDDGEGLPALEELVGVESASVNMPTDRDLIYKFEKKVVQAGENIVDFTLLHYYTEVTVTLKAKESGVNIARVEDATVGEHYANIRFAKNPSIAQQHSPFDARYTAFSGEEKSLFNNWSWPTNGYNQVTFDPVLLFSPQADDYVKIGRVELTDGGVRENLELTGINFENGHRYHLTLNVKAADESTDPVATGGTKIGNIFWAPGDLKYDSSTGYSFADAENGEIGDFFPVMSLLPWDQGGRYDGANLKDPCAAVAFQDEDGSLTYPWRTPNASDIEGGLVGEQRPADEIITLNGRSWAKFAGDIAGQYVLIPQVSAWYDGESEDDGTGVHWTQKRVGNSGYMWSTIDTYYRRTAPEAAIVEIVGGSDAAPLQEYTAAAVRCVRDAS